MYKQEIECFEVNENCKKVWPKQILFVIAGLLAGRYLWFKIFG